MQFSNAQQKQTQETLGYRGDRTILPNGQFRSTRKEDRGYWKYLLLKIHYDFSKCELVRIGMSKLFFI